MLEIELRMLVLRRSVVENRGHICGAHATVAGSAFPVVMFPRVTLGVGVGKGWLQTCFRTACFMRPGSLNPQTLRVRLGAARATDRAPAGTPSGPSIALTQPEAARAAERASARTPSHPQTPPTKPGPACATDRASGRNPSGRPDPSPPREHSRSEYFLNGEDATILVGFGSDHNAINLQDVDSAQKALNVWRDDLKVLDCGGHDGVADKWSGQTGATLRSGAILRRISNFLSSDSRLRFAGADFARGWNGVVVDGAIESGIVTARSLISEFANELN
ncbi:MAG: hypothetical protein DI630_09260 [Gordonia sp. (in: high G+C Gram-positive bacteria)]|nr:MAG: hypothetical protein DI630_09260 [Gordonia sp. (in: high G+C Gram-positive bacteria)]